MRIDGKWKIHFKCCCFQSSYGKSHRWTFNAWKKFHSFDHKICMYDYFCHWNAQKEIENACGKKCCHCNCATVVSPNRKFNSFIAHVVAVIFCTILHSTEKIKSLNDWTNENSIHRPILLRWRSIWIELNYFVKYWNCSKTYNIFSMVLLIVDDSHWTVDWLQKSDTSIIIVDATIKSTVIIYYI